MWEERAHSTKLPPKHFQGAGKLATSGGKSRPYGGELTNKALKQSETVGVSPVTPAGGYRVDGSVNGVPTSFLLDTGAAVTLLRRDTWTNITASCPQDLRNWSQLRLVGADGSPLRIHGSAHVSVELEGITRPAEAIIVSPLTTEAIIGLDFLRQYNARIDIAKQELQLGEQTLPLKQPTRQTDNEVKVRAETTTRIPPRSEMEIMACLEAETGPGTWLLEQSQGKKTTTVIARALIETKSNRVPVRVLNPELEEVTIYAGAQIAALESVNVLEGSINTVGGKGVGGLEEEKEKMLWALVEQLDPELGCGERERFFNLLLSYADIFAVSSSDLGRTSKLQHGINTGNAVPIRQPARRLPPHRQDKVRRLLNEMLEKGVIEQSTSPWASPIVLVQKKDGTIRFCVDYRKLNNVTCKDAYPLPRVDDTLDTLSGSQWFSTIDLVSGYWQVEIEEPDRPKTAFCTTEGLFQFRVMPFGLCNAPATFQRLMSLVLAGLQWSHCLVYLDDIIVLGRSFDEHLINLTMMFDRLHKAGLKLKPSKCNFLQSQVQYLGHTVSRDGVTPDPSKIEKVSTWPTPASTREVQRFLGFASYYRRFIKNFAQRAKPLHRLTERGATFRWSDECQSAFEALRQLLTSAPVLAYPNFSRQFILDTDASDVGIGAVLSQMDDEGCEHVVAYGSCLLTKAEHQYCVTRRELLAIVTFTGQFRATSSFFEQTMDP